MFRRRPATAKDTGETAKELPAKRQGAYTSERIAPDTFLSAGDEVRLNIESPRSGYLYVVSRELCADGTMQRPLLMFPSLLFYGGDNRIEPNQPRLIPDPESEVEVFEVKPSNKCQKQVAERLTIIVSPTPLPLPSPLGEEQMELPPDLIEKWERDWGGATDRADQIGSIGQTQTKREQAAARASAKDKSQSLTDDDPYPQSYYQVTVKRGIPTLIVVPVLFKAEAAASPAP